MSKRCTIFIALAVLFGGLSGGALSQEATNQTAAKDTVSLNSTVPITDEALQKLGAKSLKAADVVRAATLLTLLGAARTGGGGRPYTCTSEINECTCNGWLDCVLVMDECKTPPKNPDGTICTGEQSCTCTWH